MSKTSSQSKTCLKNCQQANQDTNNNQKTDNDQDAGHPVLGAPFFSFSAPVTPFFGLLAPATPPFGLFASRATPPVFQTIAFPLFFFILFLVFVCLFFSLSTLLDPVMSSTKILMLIYIILFFFFFSNTSFQSYFAIIERKLCGPTFHQLSKNIQKMIVSRYK